MSAVDYDERSAAIRQALGLPATTVVARGPAGWLVHVTDEQADLAFNLARKLGDSATADTFVTRGEDNTAIPLGRVTEVHGDGTATVELADNAADRERYVTERAEFIARAMHTTYERLAPCAGWETRPETQVPWERLPLANRTLMVGTVRDLIDRGVLK